MSPSPKGRKLKKQIHSINYKNMNILYVNQPLNNRGDESAHRALIRRLLDAFPNIHVKQIDVGVKRATVEEFNVHLPNMEYEILSPGKGYKKIMVAAFRYHIPWIIQFHPTLRALANRIKDSDIVLCSPGGISMGGFHNWYHVALLKMAKYYHKPIAYFGRSIGPFVGDSPDEKLFNRWSYELLHYFGFLSLRDSISLKIAQDDGLNNAILTTDSAFLETPRVAIPEEIRDLLEGKKYMVFVPNQLTWHYKYRSVNQDMIDSFYYGIMDYILEKDPTIHIVMLPQTYSSRINDANYFVSLSERYKTTGHVHPLSEKYGSDIQQTIISNAEYVIGSRYHSIVFAINNDRPFVSLSYEHKMSGLLQVLDASEYMVDITDVFGSKEDVEKALSLVKERINIIGREPHNHELCKRSKFIAENGFEFFKSYCDSIIA